MKTLKILTIVAITGATGIMAGTAEHKGQSDCTNQYNITIGDHASDTTMQKRQHRKNPNRRINHLLRKLNLSEAQRIQLKEIRKEIQQARKIQRKSLKGSISLKKFVSVDGFDKEGFINASADRAAKLVKIRADLMEKFISVLTPEQRLELVERLNKQGRRKRHQPK